MKRTTGKYLFHLLALLVAVCAVSMSFSAAAEDSADNAAGAAAYKSKCNACHGPDGSGNTPVGKSLKVADLRTEAVQKKTDAELVQFIAEGKGNMPSFKNSTPEDEIKAIVEHVRFLGAKAKAH
jgi:cytochrome c6